MGRGPYQVCEFVGQKRALAPVLRLQDGTMARGEPAPHMLFVGQSGTGKSLAAQTLGQRASTAMTKFHGKATADEMLEAAIEAGADDCESSEDGHVVYCNPDQLHQVAKALEARFGEPRAVQIMWRAKSEVPIDEETGQKLLRMIDALEELDDVQNVYANFDVAEDVLRRLTAA